MSAAAQSLRIVAGLDPGEFVELAAVAPEYARRKGIDEESAARELRRLCAEQLVQRGHANKAGGTWRIYRQADLDGVRVDKLLTGGGLARLGGHTLPPGHETWNEKDRARLLNTHELLRLYDGDLADARRDRPGLTEEEFAPVFEARHGEWARERGLSCKLRQLRDYRVRLTPGNPQFDGNVDGRGRGGVRARVNIGEQAWNFFKLLYLDPRRRSIALCHEWTTAEAAKHAGEPGWEWPGEAAGYKAVQRWVAEELPPFVADKSRLGKNRWRDKYGPFIERDHSQTRPMEAWQGDTADFDFVCDFEDGTEGRAQISAIIDEGSRVLVGSAISTQGSSHTLAAAFRDGALNPRYGLPNRITLDNGKAERARALSGGKRKLSPKDERRLTSIFGRAGVEVHFTRTYAPRSKGIIERFFETMHERFDKLFTDTYCGGDTKFKPEDLQRSLRSARKPTITEVRARFAEWVAAYHLRPHSGDGMDDLSPFDKLERGNPIARRTRTEAELTKILQETVEAVVTRRGVRFGKIRYGQAAKKLWKLQGKTKKQRTVMLRLDWSDASQAEVLDATGQHFICTVYQQRNRGLTHDDIKAGMKLQAEARKLADAARPAMALAHKSVSDIAHGIAAQRAHAEQLRKAAGAESWGPAPPRDLALLHCPVELGPRRGEGRDGPAGPDGAADPPDADLAGLPPLDGAPAPEPEYDEDFDVHLDGAATDGDAGPVSDPEDVELKPQDAAAAPEYAADLLLRLSGESYE
ncbi:MAG: Mu transposase C-terminal domain-containing protein [Planctomycetota bacterium]